MSDAPKSWFRPRLRTILIVALLAVVVGSVYSYWAEYQENVTRKARETMSPSVGAHCRVYCQESFYKGTFLMHNVDWIVLETGTGQGKQQVWIPRAKVTLMYVND